MIFRQLFDHASSTYTYLLAGASGGQALIIDPVLDRVDRYIQLLDELDVRLVKALDTHVHADHVTGLGALRDRTRCVTVMGAESKVDVVSVRVGDGDRVDIDGISLEAMHTPGHTDDSYCYRMADRVFTGDTKFIRGTGRTDFQHGDSHAAYDSLFHRLLTLPDETLVYPGHDYKGESVSTIGEERAHNPRLQVASPEEHAELMAALNLPNPKMMDVAVPANLAIGAVQGGPDQAWCLECADAAVAVARADVVLVDLREDSERRSAGAIPGSLHAPYGELERFLSPGGILHYEGAAARKRLVYYCAFGERSALAVKTSQEMGIVDVCHIVGGMDAWSRFGGPIESAG